MKLFNSFVGGFIGLVLAAMFSDGIYKLISHGHPSAGDKIFFFYFVVAPICVVIGIIGGICVSKKR